MRRLKLWFHRAEIHLAHSAQLRLKLVFVSTTVRLNERGIAESDD